MAVPETPGSLQSRHESETLGGLLAIAVVAFPPPAVLDRPTTEAKSNDDHGRSDEQGDDVGDHQRHDPDRSSMTIHSRNPMSGMVK
jgi:hypothetical protein